MKKLNNYLEDDKEVLINNDENFIKKHNVKEDVVINEDLSNKVEKHIEKEFGFIYYLIAIFAALLLIVSLIYTLQFLPEFGSTSSIVLNDIYIEYIENGITKTGATNFVTGMILDYRAFDTLGESFVLFTAVNCVLILLQDFKDKKEIITDENGNKIHIGYHLVKDPILRSSCSILVPIILLFGAYVILNGSISPGGGFSGGAIMGAGLILYSIAFGFEKSGKFFTNKTFKTISSIALLTYCLSKTYSFLTGVLNTESIVPLGIPGAILSGGIIFILNVAVGMVVTCTMFGFYSLFKKGEI